MNINPKLKNNKKLAELLETKDINISLADFYNELIDSQEAFDELKNYKHDSSSLLNMVINHCELEEQRRLLEEYASKTFMYVDYSSYLLNSYYQNIKPKEIIEKGYKLKYLNYPKNTFFALDDIVVNTDTYKETSKIGISEDTYSYLALIKDNTIWMLITPNEINTMSKSIEEANGNVIVFGLGLGYYPYMCAMKEEVKSITIIENDKNIIQIFNKYLYPQFKNKNKINVINTDAYEFILNNNLKDYDYAFFDLWHNPNDGILSFLNINSYDLKCKKSFWLETSLIALIRRYLLTLIEESLAGYQDKDYIKEENDDDKVINILYAKTKNITLNNEDDIVKFLSDDSIKKLIEN